MTTPPALPRPGAVLVGATTPPSPRTDRFVDLRPGPVATFAGNRFRALLHVSVEGPSAVERRFRFREVDAAASTALEWFRGRDCQVVRFGDRERLRRLWPTPTVDRAERRLANDVPEAGGTVLAWTSARPTESRRYDEVREP